jgi:predicted MPP superfamily phosphohydrolase
MKRRAFIKNCIKLGLAGAAAAPLYSHFIERSWLEIQQIQLSFKQLPAAFHGLRIAHFSDVHLGFYFDEDDLKKLVAAIQRLKPDLICFTGDMVEGEVDILQRSIEILKELEAPLGKFAVLGNHDYWEDAEGVVSALKSSGFVLLRNELTRIKRGSEHIVIAGVDDIIYGEPKLDLIMTKIQPEDECIVLLAHEPDFADITKQYPIQLQLSGHSHGGQIRLPLLGAVVTPPYGKKYPDRLYRIEQLTLYTTRGIGTTSLPLRMFCRPELTIIQLNRS